MRTVRTGPVVGLLGEVALLVALAFTVGLTSLGWVVGVATGLVACGLLARGLARADTKPPGMTEGASLDAGPTGPAQTGLAQTGLAPTDDGFTLLIHGSY